jgi:selenium-binding protein 1
MAMQAPRENLGYVVTFNPEAKRQQPDALCVMDLNPESQTYGTVVGRTEMPGPNRYSSDSHSHSCGDKSR